MRRDKKRLNMTTLKRKKRKRRPHRKLQSFHENGESIKGKLFSETKERLDYMTKSLNKLATGKIYRNLASHKKVKLYGID